MAMAIPLIREKTLADLFAYQGPHTRTVQTFLGDAQALAETLPARDYVLNLCGDRYHFVVGFAAALMRGQVSLLPPNHADATLAQLQQTYADLYCLVDSEQPTLTLPCVRYPKSNAAKVGVDIPAFPPEQLAAIVFTSGSTGQPLPYEKTWRSLTQGALASADRFGLNAMPGLALLATVPAQHMYGLESSVLLALQSSACLHAGRPFFPADVGTAAAALPRPRGLVTTPVHLRALLESAVALPPLDFILCATAPLNTDLARSAEQKFAAPVYEIYGCTEAGQVASRRPVQTHLWTPFKAVQLRQTQAGTWASGGHIAQEIALSDHIELKGEGRFVLHGRMADLINIAGKRTSLAHLNHQLTTIPGVLDGVFIMPQQDESEVSRLTAFVVAPGLTAEDIVQALRLRVDPVFLPRPLCLVTSLPRNATGKITHSVLSELQQAHAVNAN